jgi:histidyl-tRNA synthetase
MACKAENSLPINVNQLDLFVAPITDEAKTFSFKLLSQLRDLGIKCDMAYGDRGLKGAMKAADKSGATYALVIGDDEIATGTCELKLMSSGEVISSTLAASDLIVKLGTKN